MSMKSSLLSMLVLSAMVAGDKNVFSQGKHTAATVPVVPPRPKGLKKWNINGVEVWAATKKAAIKKANKSH